MASPIQRLNLVSVSSSHEARTIGKRIADFVGTPQGQRFASATNRAVVVAADQPPADPALYLSDGAMEAATQSGMHLEASLRVHPSQLPGAYSLLLGQKIDILA